MVSKDKEYCLGVGVGNWIKGFDYWRTDLMETLDHRILKMTFLLLGGFISFTEIVKS